MPTLNDVVGTGTETKPPETTAPVVTAVVVSKKKTKKVEATDTPAAKTEITEKPEEKKFLRPPLEILTQDFERFLTTLLIGTLPLKRLGYKCGKVIYGIPQQKTDGSKAKDFRVIAFKARKKSEKVEGKSRCIFYFGLNDHIATSELKANYLGAQTSKFGKCSVQSKCPIEIVLDKVTFTDTFNKDIEKVFDVLKRLAILSVEQKTIQFNNITKVEPKKKVAKE
jgi:hypothetical protein